MSGAPTLSSRMLPLAAEFLGVGPILGWVIVNAATLSWFAYEQVVGRSQAFSDYDIAQQLPGYIMFSVVIAYALGFMPAALTGILCSTFSTRLHSTSTWIAGCASVGFAVTVVCAGLFFGFSQTMIDAISMISLIGLVGALAAAGCGWTTRRSRFNGTSA